LSLISLKEALDEADKHGYAVGAFNVSNMETVKAVIESAEAENSPVIIQATPGAVQYAGLSFVTSMVKAAVKNTSVPVAFHLDHGTDFELIVRCIVKGFSSIMFDGSKLPLEENISATARIVEFAKAAGVSTEGELGKIKGTEDEVSVQEGEDLHTDPEEARYFLQETEVDALAVAVGTAHGFYKEEPEIDFSRLQAIRDSCSVPLVMHGASGVPDEDIVRGIELGIRKINIDTEIRQAFIKSISRYIEENPGNLDPRKMMRPAMEEMKKVIREKIRLFGSSGKA